MARNEVLIIKELYLNKTFNFQLDKSTQIDLIKIRTNDFYKLLTTKTHIAKHKGPQKWDKHFVTKRDVWKKRFASLCKEPKAQRISI